MPSHAGPVDSGGWALHRSVTLLHVFFLASAGILFIGASTLGWLLTTSLQRQALDDKSTSLTQYVDGVLRPQLVRGDKLHISPHLSLQLKAQLRRQPDLLSVKVWRPDGTLVWTNRAPERIGQRFSSALLGDLGDTIDKGQAHASISSLDGADDAVERGLGVDHVFEVYAPIMGTDGRRALGAYEIYAKPQHTESFIASGKRFIWMVVIAVFLSLYAAHRASRSQSLLDDQAAGGDASGTFGGVAGVVPQARGELARGDREPQRDGRCERPVHRRSFGTRSGHRPRRRGGARAAA